MTTPTVGTVLTIAARPTPHLAGAGLPSGCFEARDGLMWRCEETVTITAVRETGDTYEVDVLDGNGDTYHLPLTDGWEAEYSVS